MTGVQRRGAPTPTTFAGLAAERYAPVGPPDGPPIVIVHGAMDRAAGFRRTARHLPNRDIVAYDRRGYAGSRHVPVAERFEVQVDDLVAVLEELVADDGAPRLVVGHSAGGLIALHALARPGIERLVVGAFVWEAPLAWNDWYTSRGSGLLDLDPADAAESFMRGVLGSRLWERLPATMQAERRAEGPALRADMVNARSAEAAVDLTRITLPIVVGHGTESSEHHQRSATEAAADLPACRLVELDGADHGVHLSSPTAFAELIASWRPDPARSGTDAPGSAPSGG